MKWQNVVLEGLQQIPSRGPSAETVVLSFLSEGFKNGKSAKLPWNGWRRSGLLKNWQVLPHTGICWDLKVLFSSFWQSLITLVWWEGGRGQIWVHNFQGIGKVYIWIFCEIESKTTLCVKNEETGSEMFYQKVIFLSLQNISPAGNNRFMKSATIISLIYYSSK